jgi:hypothetical protein
MDAVSCSAPATRIWMQLRARLCCHAQEYSFVPPAIAHARTTVPEGTTFACAPLPHPLMKHLRHKIFAATYIQIETDKIFTTYAYVYRQCNIQIKYLQHTFETAETFEIYTCNLVYSQCNICNIQIKHLRLKHLKHTLTTYVYSHYNICDTRSTFATSK